MRDTLIIIGVAIVAIAVGIVLYIYVPAQADQPAVSGPAPVASGGVSFAVLKQGTNAPSSFTRTNYRLTSADQLAELWTMLYGTNAPAAPYVDFDKQEVVAVFDGTHSTGGYSIGVSAISDQGGTRTVSVTHSAPGTDCMVTESVTSPYELITMPKTTFAFRHEDADATSTCS